MRYVTANKRINKRYAESMHRVMCSTCKREANDPKSYRTVAEIDFILPDFVIHILEHRTRNPPSRRCRNIFQTFRVFLFFVRSFNLPRVAQQLERLMGSRWEREIFRFSSRWAFEPLGFVYRFSVVRLTDRKYMLDLQKRIQEDYHDTLMKRISTRQVSDWMVFDDAAISTYSLLYMFSFLS